MASRVEDSRAKQVVKVFFSRVRGILAIALVHHDKFPVFITKAGGQSFFLFCTEEGVNELIPHHICQDTLKQMVSKQEARQQEF